VIKERIYLDKADPDTLYDEITVLDHALTRPYSKIQKATRNPNPRPVWYTDVCSENNTHIRIENENYFGSADGKLMPSKNNQAPPDLHYFKQTPYAARSETGSRTIGRSAPQSSLLLKRSCASADLMQGMSRCPRLAGHVPPMGR
jgi:hypothetical protein